jgi:hypothetical protein
LSCDVVKTARHFRIPPEKSRSKKVAAKLFILQGGAEPFSFAPVWAELSQLLIGM